MAAILVVVAAGPQPRGECGRQLPARARERRVGIDPRNAVERPPNHCWALVWFVEAIPAGAGNAAGSACISIPDRAAGSMVLALGILRCAQHVRGRLCLVHLRDDTNRGAVFLPVV